MEVYWDQVLVDDGRAAAEVRTTTLLPSQAELRFHGFPRRLRRDPEEFDYHDAAPTGPYARAAGLYTRYGDVAPLLAGTDDQFAILGPGDAVDAGLRRRRPPRASRRLGAIVLLLRPRLREGHGRPHRGAADRRRRCPSARCRRIPYPAGEAYPSGPEHLEYRLRYNTRRVDREAWTTPAGPEPRP